MSLGDPHDSGRQDEAQITVTRLTVVRVAGTVDDRTVTALRGILYDLVHGHGLTDLAIDLTKADTLEVNLSDLLSQTQQGVLANGGFLEVRFADSEDIPAVAPLPVDVPAFVVVEPDDQARA